MHIVVCAAVPQMVLLFKFRLGQRTCSRVRCLHRIRQWSSDSLARCDCRDLFDFMLDLVISYYMGVLE